MVSHPKLLYKLNAIGIKGNLLNWIRLFLSERKQLVIINGVKSDWQPVISGVIQGSVLGPLLFLIYINDISNCIIAPSKLLLFVDDLKLYCNSSDPTNSLTTLLNSIADWCNLWQMKINVNKCSSLSYFTKDKNIFKFLNADIQPMSDCKDLGIIFDSNANFICHINKIVALANQCLKLIFHCFHSKSMNFLLRTYKIYVRPVLEYGSMIWSPFHITLINKIESVQRRFTRMVPGLHSLTYIQRLIALGLEPLELRRLHIDLRLLHKSRFGLTNLDFNEFFTIVSTPRQQDKILIKASRTDLMLYSFFRKTKNVEFFCLIHVLLSQPRHRSAAICKINLNIFLKGNFVKE